MPIAGAAIALLSATMAIAADLTTLVTLAVQPVIGGFADDYARTSGHRVVLDFDTGPNLARRVAAGATADVLIAPAAVVDQAVADGRVLGESRAAIGKVAIGIAVRAGARVPDISSPAALRRTLLDSAAVVYSQGTSGAHVQKVLTDLGVADVIRSKTLPAANGSVAMERIIAGRDNEIGFTMISEIKAYEAKGVKLVGPLPASLQNYTTYLAAVMTQSPNREAAAGFVRHITTPAARQVLVATGWE
jgi:molybdate transport system substrate-binding protein